MSLGSWIPEDKKASIALPEVDFICGLARLSSDGIPSMNEDDLALIAPTMQVGVKIWMDHLDALGDDDLLKLLRFFTVLEMEHSQCRGDQHSPAIACAKLLRKRGASLDKELLRWIRSVSDNRYLPYGPL